MKLLLERWKKYLNEVSFADAKKVLNSKQTKKAILNYMVANVAKKVDFNDEEAKQKFNNFKSQIVDSELPRAIKDYTREIERYVPNDLEDNQRGATILWLNGLAKRDSKVMNAFLNYTAYIDNVRGMRNLELFFHNLTYMSEKDLFKIESFEDLSKIVNEAEPKYRAAAEKKSYLDADQGKLKIAETDEYVVYIPTNKGAACELGKGTDWCTAAPGLDYYEEYHKEDDPLIIFKHKESSNLDRQFHYGTEQFMDPSDTPVSDLEMIELSDIIRGNKHLTASILNIIDQYAYKDLGNGRKHIRTPESQSWYLNGKRHREDGPAVEYASGTKHWYLNGMRHREDGPAIEHASGAKEWYLNGKFHREDGPAIERINGSKLWYLNGKLHREDGPAVERADGAKVWYLNGKLHREDGPAVEHANGTKEWFLNGKLHREDGPAIEYSDGTKEWYLNDKSLTEEEFNSQLNKANQPLREHFKRFMQWA
jgi:hypothetical protein